MARPPTASLCKEFQVRKFWWSTRHNNVWATSRTAGWARLAVPAVAMTSAALHAVKHTLRAAADALLTLRAATVAAHLLVPAISSLRVAGTS